MMKEYHKIQSIFKRDEKTHKFIDGNYSIPEFEYLQNNQWEMTEKIDGTNIRIGWIPEVGINIGGRTDNAQIPPFLQTRLHEMFSPLLMQSVFPETSVILFGEGYGARIQKGGGNYIPNGCDFILFDVLIGDWWLQRKDVVDIASRLRINVVPVIGYGTIRDAIKITCAGMKSTFGDFIAEGLVLKPVVPLFARGGARIITKVKHRDF